MSPRGRNRLVLSLLLAGLTVVAWLPALDCDFVNYDDRTYVTENLSVQRGVNGASLHWAFTSYHAANWHPLTWVTHMVDWSLYGPEPRGHHLTNLLLHLANTLLVFLILETATAASVRSAAVAGLFAVHPLHVESVAWIAERKDVLSTLFWLVGLAAWVAWTRRPGAGRYALVVLAMAASLTAKPMAVTFPLTLLLLDLWPLGRVGEGGARRWRELVVEKLPMFALSGLSSLVTVLAQSGGGAVRALEDYTLPVRLANAAVAYATYVVRTVWPLDLAVFYPHPGSGIAIWKVVASVVALVAATGFALRAWRRAPYVTAGWLWYVVTLVPVIGVVQVGEQAMADRYTYVPLLGIFVVVAWGLPALVEARWPGDSGPKALTAVAVVALVLLSVGTRAQLRHWRDGEALFRRALAVTENNATAHVNLGVALAARDRLDEAIENYEAALVLRPWYARAWVNLGNAHKRSGRPRMAREKYLRALEIDPDNPDAYYNLGLLLDSEGRSADAVAAYRRALEIDPGDPRVHNNLGSSLARVGRFEEAIESFRVAIRLRPVYGRAHANLAGALLVVGRPAEAWEAVEEARRHGFEPPEPLLRDLRRQMPGPGR